MAKKVVSSVPLHSKKITKGDKKKKKFLINFKRVIDFLKSDNYMFAPLFDFSQTSDHVVSCTTFTGIEGIEPIKEKNDKMFEVGKVKEYMKSDCYMYAPLVIHQPWLHPSILAVNPVSGPVSSSEKADTGRKGNSLENATEETRGLGQKIKSISFADQSVDGHPNTRSTVIKHSILQQETVKRVIRQNCRSSSARGKVLLGANGRKLV